MASLTMPGDPLIEKASVFLFYQSWARGQSLVVAAHDIARSARTSRVPASRTPHARVLKLFGADLRAQLLRDYSQRQRYLGLDTFIDMSAGLPRNLLVILKNSVRWATFLGESPFSGHPISDEAQREGVLESSKWYFDYVIGTGHDGVLVRDMVGRLGSFLRVLRFTDKPVESSLATVSFDESALSAQARRLIDIATQWNLLLPIPRGQRDRNSGAVVHAYQLNGMLCPLWDLPIYRRGITPLTTTEAAAIFDPEFADRLELVTSARRSRMNAPFKGMGHRGDEEPQSTLWAL
jgi:hypothetical protein